MLQTMDQREATVLRMRFGLDGYEPRTLKEIGEVVGDHRKVMSTGGDRVGGRVGGIAHRDPPVGEWCQHRGNLACIIYIGAIHFGTVDSR